MKTVALISGSESTVAALSKQLSEYIGDKIPIHGYSLNSGIPEIIEGDLVVLSSTLVHEDIRRLGRLPADCELIIATRVVDSEALEQVVALEPGTKALFVNDTAETVADCLGSLRDLGLDHVDWRGWYPGLPAPDPAYRIAVVAGEPDLVPASATTIIDIGNRIFDFGTILEILGRLGIPNADIGRYSRRYLAKIVSLARRLARSTEEARLLSGHLGSVIDSLRNGILVYAPDGRVSVCNEELRDLLSLRGAAGVGSALSSIIRQRELLEFLECRCGEDENVFRLPSGSVVVRRFDLADGDHTVAVFRSELDQAAEAERQGREYRRRGHVAKWAMDDIVGDSAVMREAKRVASRLAATELSILINGESGTGKELFASAIHAASARACGPFLAVNLGSLSDDLIESELFGYEEGAFTGAKKGGKAGLFERADGGTLFLDEIGSISAKVQTRLLRVLQEKEVMRVGGADIKRVDVRIIAATKEDLLEKSRAGGFREDLYFRLKMGWLRIPALRERLEDIPALVRHIAALEGVAGIAVEPSVLEALSSRDWHGNVRELRNALSYMLAIREGEGLSMRDLPDGGYFSGTYAPRTGEPPATARPQTSVAACHDDGSALRESERMVLLAVAELESAGKHAGRSLVAELAKARGFSLGEGGARSAMVRLVALGHLESSRGRGGTRLTASGRRVAIAIAMTLTETLAASPAH
ncbi:MAG: hypothetical protein A2Y38_23375 [Spirochaetes bacterium GWB1_59_5]|nr:MAG: hypothetical protein A2Y38_23375 [Spirochaetes bacterium GWB1_59_5]